MRCKMRLVHLQFPGETPSKADQASARCFFVVAGFFRLGLNRKGFSRSVDLYKRQKCFFDFGGRI